MSIVHSVKIIQNILEEIGFTGGKRLKPGIFDAATEKAVLDFQQQNGGKFAASATANCSQCGGAGVVRMQQGFFAIEQTCSKCGGAGQVIKNPCKSCHGHGVEKQKKSIEVSIPAGVDTGVKLRIQGEGNYGANGGEPGDLYIFIHVKEHTFFKRDGEDVYVEIHVPMTDAILGTGFMVAVAIKEFAAVPVAVPFEGSIKTTTGGVASFTPQPDRKSVV